MPSGNKGELGSGPRKLRAIFGDSDQRSVPGENRCFLRFLEKKDRYFFRPMNGSGKIRRSIINFLEDLFFPVLFLSEKGQGKRTRKKDPRLSSKIASDFRRQTRVLFSRVVSSDFDTFFYCGSPQIPKESEGTAVLPIPGPLRFPWNLRGRPFLRFRYFFFFRYFPRLRVPSDSKGI